jgi:hypothetical protein
MSGRPPAHALLPDGTVESSAEDEGSRHQQVLAPLAPHHTP